MRKNKSHHLIYSLLLLVSLFIISCSVSKENNERETVNDTSENSQNPNILFVISDDQSYMHTSFSESKFVHTPAFDRIAKEGIYFSNCYTSSPGCAPSRSSIVTGRHHWQNEQTGQHGSSFLSKHVTFLDELEANGYKLGRTGKGVSPFRYAEEETDTFRRQGNAGGPGIGKANYKENDERTASGIAAANYAENFKYFIDSIRGDDPFFYWFGAHEPHRSFEKGSWKKNGKKLEDAVVPKFLPDNDEIRGDILDYAVEIEWYDSHLQKMINHLEEIGELDNTIIIVTSDNGMAFPRAKANCFDYGVHVPFAIRFPKSIEGGKVMSKPISLVDLAPTILAATKTTPKNMMPITGTSMWDWLTSDKEPAYAKASVGRQKEATAVFSGRERHSSSRYLNHGYPQRSIRKGDHLLIWNARPERWSAGAPQKYDAEDSTKLLPMYGIDEEGKYIGGMSAFTDIDDSPSKIYLIESKEEVNPLNYFDLSFGKRPEFELYNIENDMDCIHNLIGQQELSDVESELKENLFAELKRTKDPRVVGPDTAIFDSYKRYMHIRKFPEPDLIE